MPSPMEYTNMEPFSYHLKHLARSGGGRSGLLSQFMSPFDLDHIRMFDDFNCEVFDPNVWTVATDAGATAFVVRTGDPLGTMVRGNTSATANTYIGIHSTAPHWFGDKNCMLEVRFRITTVTDLDMEIGFADAITDKTLPIVTDVDTPTIGNGAVDCCLFKLATNQTLTTGAFVTEGSAASQVPTATTLSPAFTPTTAEWHTVRVGLFNPNYPTLAGNSYGFLHMYDSDTPDNMVLTHEIYRVGTTASSVKGSVGLLPFILVGTVVGVDVTADIDYILVVQER